MLTLMVTSIQGLLKLIPSSDVTLLCHSANVNVTGNRMVCILDENGGTILPGERRLLKGGGKLLTYELLCRDCNGSAGSPPSL